MRPRSRRDRVTPFLDVAELVLAMGDTLSLSRVHATTGLVQNCFTLAGALGLRKRIDICSTPYGVAGLHVHAASRAC